jgi:invasion protein IalB
MRLIVRVIAVICVASWVCPAPGAAADEKKETAYRDWALRYSSDTTGWVLEQRVFIEGHGKSPIAWMTVQEVETENAEKETEAMLWVVVGVPLNTLISGGVELQVDAGDPMAVSLHHCRATGCIAMLPLDSDIRAAFEAGLKARVTFHLLNGQGVGVPISLMGFNAGLAALEKKTAGGG